MPSGNEGRRLVDKTLAIGLAIQSEGLQYGWSASAWRLWKSGMSPKFGMRFILTFCFACASPTYAASPAKSPKAPATAVNVRTAVDLANACTVSPDSKANFARLNFCNGFAQGILQTNGQNSSGTKICLPRPSPKRSDTMKEFAVWVHADASRKDDVASVAFLRFMGERFPCT